MAICEQCGTVYEAKRASSRFCSDKCRTKNGRVSERNRTQVLSERLDPVTVIPDWAGPHCECRMCQGSAAPLAINHGPYMDAKRLAVNGFNRNRVPLPGDPDYVDAVQALHCEALAVVRDESFGSTRLNPCS